MRGTGSHDVVLEDVLVPHDVRLPGEEAPGIGDPRGWNVGSGAVYTGHRGGSARLRGGVRAGPTPERPAGRLDRRVPGGPAPSRRDGHADLAVPLDPVRHGRGLGGAARTARRLAWQVNASKYVATNNAIRVTDLALRVVGSAGLARGLPLERYFRDARAGLGNPPMDDIALTLIGKAALGM